jgi:septum formation protein
MNITQIIDINKRIVLASQSPRRKFLLEMLGLEFEVKPASIEEINHGNLSPEQYVMSLAIEKAKAAALEDAEGLYIGSDTIVVLGNEILEKPADSKDAAKMLQKLSSNTHTVYTGVALFDSANKKEDIRYEETKVSFRQLNAKEIDAYISTGSPMDKAGAYGIQDDFGAVFVNRIEGCYYNIVGLPLQLLYKMLMEYFT